MLSFIVLFTVAFALPQLKREVAEQPKRCNLEHAIMGYEYVTIKENGQMAFIPSGQCISYDGLYAKYDPCTFDFLKVTECNSNGGIDEDAQVTYIKLEEGIEFLSEYPEELESHKMFPHSVEIIINGYLTVFMSKECITEEGVNGQNSVYYKMEHDGTTITKKYYTDAECKTAKTGDGATETIDCEKTITEDDVSYFYTCPVLGIKCDPNVVGKYKYLSMIYNGETVYSALDEFTINFTYNDDDQIIHACTDTEVLVEHYFSSGRFDDASMKKMENYGYEYVENLPEHTGYLNVKTYGDSTGWILPFKNNQCVTSDGYSYKFTVANGEVTKYSGDDCGNLEEIETVKCGTEDYEEEYYYICNEFNPTCDPNLESEYKYIKIDLGEGMTMYQPFNECMYFEDTFYAFRPCSLTHVIATECKGNEPVEEASFKKEMTSYKASYVKEIPSYTFKMQMTEGCFITIFDNVYIELVIGPEEDGMIQRTVQNGKHLFLQYLNATTNEIVEEMYAFECSCNEYGMNVICGKEGNCDAGIEDKNYKYLRKTEQGQINLIPFGQCVKYDDKIIAKFEACTETHVQMTTCDENGYITYMLLSELGLEYATEELPPHIAYGKYYSDAQCGDDKETGMMVLFQNDCIEDGDNSVKYIIDGNKIIIKSFTGKECKKAGTDDQQECDKCVSEEGINMKFICHEFGKENGAMNTFLLLVLALIFFLF